ncbi:MAG: hypothetical protein JO356_04100 [Acidobacteria bacterium]|nr:hypothetical protein [Acidobacteriota bacterium]
MATITRLIITSNLLAFLHRRASLVRAEGMQVWLNRSDFSMQSSNDDQNATDRFEADDSVLEIAGKIPAHALKFRLRHFSLTHSPATKLTRFAAEFENPLPPGLVRTSGQFGPWNSFDPSETALSGSYSLENADLARFESIAGLTYSQGKFAGTFSRLEVEAETKTPEFKVTETGHALPLETHFHAVVDTKSGNVSLERVHASFGRDQIEARGTIAEIANGPRTAILDFDCRRGRIEDTFYPFIHSPTSPLMGVVSFTMHVVVPGGSERFLKRIQLNSDFRLQDARFTHDETQSRLNKIAEVHDRHEPQPGDTFSDFEGRVRVSGGIAHFSQLSLEDGGASAQFRGSYNLVDERVDMHGKLETQATLANTTHGMKAAFAKVLEPFFKKKPHQNVVPVRIGGTYAHPNFGLDLNTKM